MKLLTPTVALCIGLLTGSGANAALVSALGGQVVNDTDLNITWLANANLAATNTFGVSGIDPAGYMSWSTAQSWIGAMNTANYLGYSDWRLPNADPSCGFNYNCTNSEMGHLFYTELGGGAGQSITTTHNTIYGLFQNVQSDTYWSGTEYAPYPSSAWVFNTFNGYQGAFGKASPYMFALAVRPGQVVATPVPGATLLLGSGLLGLIGVARRKAA